MKTLGDIAQKEMQPREMVGFFKSEPPVFLQEIGSTEKAFSKYKLNYGEEFTYGYGWHLKEIAGSPAREHGGSIFGFKTMESIFLKVIFM